MVTLRLSIVIMWLNSYIVPYIRLIYLLAFLLSYLLPVSLFLILSLIAYFLFVDCFAICYRIIDFRYSNYIGKVYSMMPFLFALCLSYMFFGYAIRRMRCLLLQHAVCHAVKNLDKPSCHS